MPENGPQTGNVVKPLSVPTGSCLDRNNDAEIELVSLIKHLKFVCVSLIPLVAVSRYHLENGSKVEAKYFDLFLLEA